MPLLRHQVILPYTSALDRDASVNVFHSSSVDKTRAEQALDVSAAIADFYNEPTGVGAETILGAYYSQIVSRAADTSVVRTFDLADPMPRTPILEYFFNMVGHSEANSLPYEVALCSSFTADGAGESAPIRRRRGRIYTGPFNLDALQGGAVPTPAVTLVDTLVAATERLVTTVGDVATSTFLGVYSRVDGLIRPITSGWVDNEFDTQRRRQRDATARTEWDVGSI